jgi:hypothetical protein
MFIYSAFYLNNLLTTKPCYHLNMSENSQFSTAIFDLLSLGFIV